MNKEEQINKMIDETLNSVDGAARAEAKPYLLTRINARLSRPAESAWERAGRFIGRPAVAFTGLCMVLLINAMVVVFNGQNSSSTATEQVTQSDEFSYSVATIYDVDNTQSNDQ